jgi:hypothetical protein
MCQDDLIHGSGLKMHVILKCGRKRESLSHIKSYPNSLMVAQETCNRTDTEILPDSKKRRVPGTNITKRER